MVATRFSSAKPAPDGACVRSPSTHQLPSGPRPISKATKCRKCPRARLDADQRAQPFGVVGDQAGRQDARRRPAGCRRRGRPRPSRAGRRAGSGPAAMLVPFRPRISRRAHGLSGQSRSVGAGVAIVAEEHAGIAQILVAAREALGELVGASAPSRCGDQAPPRPGASPRRVEQFVRHARQAAGSRPAAARRRSCCLWRLPPWPSDPGGAAQVERHRETRGAAFRAAARRRRQYGRAARSGQGGAPRPRCR